MPSNAVAHICLVVEDLDRAIEDWTKILRVLDPEQLEEPIVRYDDFEAAEDSMRWATFVSHSGPEIQLMEPGADTPLGRRLAKHGEHVHHICFTTSDVPGTMARLQEEGVKLKSDETFRDPAMPWQEWSWVPPAATHGTLVEVARPYRAVEGKWESAT
ncbi:MAG TPA: VOC family protein [Solirubrobacteraceae bacterium]|jgi:methylmalonyl-CoA/ethylmalonyl-CoA epimerase|nr:VOC family protein [Solirubrobacteraceae bacterium]